MSYNCLGEKNGSEVGVWKLMNFNINYWRNSDVYVFETKQFNTFFQLFIL